MFHQDVYKRQIYIYVTIYLSSPNPDHTFPFFSLFSTLIFIFPVSRSYSQFSLLNSIVSYSSPFVNPILFACTIISSGSFPSYFGTSISISVLAIGKLFISCFIFISSCTNTFLLSSYILYLPVSYTHLDVYKRQIYICFGCCYFYVVSISFSILV